MKSFDNTFAPASAPVMEKMLNEAIAAKDRFRVGD